MIVPEVIKQADLAYWERQEETSHQEYLELMSSWKPDPDSGLYHPYPRMKISDFSQLISTTIVEQNLSVSEDMRFLVEPKILGVGIKLFYENGRLKRAHLKQGSLGSLEIPLSDLKDVRGLPKSISTRKLASIEISGELYLAPYDLIRNGVDIRAGADLSSCSLLALKILKQERLKSSLSFIAHGVLYSSINLGQQKSKLLGALLELGFETPLEVILGGVNEAVQHLNWLNTIQQTLEYPISGVVVKLNDTVMTQMLKPYIETTIVGEF